MGCMHGHALIKGAGHLRAGHPACLADMRLEVNAADSEEQEWAYEEGSGEAGKAEGCTQ